MLDVHDGVCTVQFFSWQGQKVVKPLSTQACDPGSCLQVKKQVKQLEGAKKAHQKKKKAKCGSWGRGIKRILKVMNRSSQRIIKASLSR